MFVAVARVPSDANALQRAAEIAGMAVADASRLLAGTLPRVLVRATDEGARMAGALESAGFVAFACEDSAVATEKDRVVARNLEFSTSGLVAVDGRGQRFECPYSSIAALIRGIRLVASTEVIKSTERKLALGKALLTGGLSVTKKVETVQERTTSMKEAFLLLQRSDGEPAILLCEPRLNYQCLGKGIQPSTFGNFMALLARLRELAPHAPLDDRITRPGFLSGLPLMAVDPVDLAIHLVQMAQARGC